MVDGISVRMKDRRAWIRALLALVHLAKRRQTVPYIAQSPTCAEAAPFWHEDNVAIVTLGTWTLLFETVAERERFVAVVPGAIILDRLPFIEELNL